MIVDRERILITVKTYPTLSTKYGETVCTAGVRPDGSWIRLYPVPFRRLEEEQQYRKYDWLECRVIRQTKDPRPESFRPVDEAELVAVAHIGTADRWRERRDLLLKTGRVYDKRDELITGAKTNQLSLATFKPTKVHDFVWEQEERDWDPEKLRKMRELHSQLDLFSDNAWRKTFNVIPKLPYSFSYRFRDANGKESKLQVLDWELGALYWNCLRSSEGNEPIALEKVRSQYFDNFLKTDLHFYLGTTQEWHFRSPNPWVIVGLLYIPHETQLDLFQ